jgi:hypothetical protein
MPWAAEECRQAGVVHVGDSVRAMSKAVWEAFYGLLPTQPTLILGQQHGGCGDLAARQALADHHRPTRAIIAAGVGLAALGTARLRSHRTRQR